MVATVSPIADPYPLPAEWVKARRGAEVLYTVKDVEAMIKAGIVPEDGSTELLHGVLLHKDRSKLGEDPLSIGDEHTICVESLSDLRTQINSPERHVRSQQPVVCGEKHDPEPDFIIVRGSLRGLKGKATAADVLCVVEVADSSYERDSGEKLFGYARAGIPQYIIINLRNRTAEVYTNPDSVAGTYPPPLIVAAEQSLSLRVGEAEFLAVPLVDLLP
jgi:Uma2 family endonuclease